MSISNRGSNTPVGYDAPLGDNPSVGDQFNRFEVGISTPADDVGNPGFEVGISTPADDVGNPGFEIGISAPADDVGNPGFEIGISVPTGDVVSPGDTPAGNDALSGDLPLGSWEEVTHLTIAEGCSCAACQGMREANGGDNANTKGGDPNSSNPESGNIGVLLPLGTNPDGSHFFSGNRNVDATLIGSKWGTLNLTYSFPTSGTNYNGIGLDSNGVNAYHIDLGLQQQAAARAAFAQVSAATGITFTEIVETDTVHANIRISQSADQDVPSAYGGFPSDTRGVAGDSWFGRTNQPYYDLAARGSWGFSTMMHEIGHTMGLKHGHQDYTFADLSFYFGSTPRFGSQSLTPDRDGQAWSLMTYSPAPGVGQPFAGDKISQPQTYMQYDLAALQYMYGANFDTNSGDSVYTFSETTGEMFINGVGQGAPSGNRILLTIWDGNGNDTINASNYAGGVTIDLRPGEFSTFDQAQLVNHLAYRNTGVAMAPGNIAMSLLYNNDTRSLIENATGGAGNDIFVGNTANNVLDGGSGGSDTVIFTSTTGVNVTLNDAATDVLVNHDGETDTLRSIENIGGTSGNDTIIGNSVDNLLTGGSGGTDVLTGLGGNDRLIGGGFTVTTNFIVGSPPSQPDITKPQATNNGSIGTAVNTAGAYDIDANANISDATTIPHATINGTAFGGVVEYYRIDVTGPGAQAIFDIDGGGTLDDSILELVDSAGNVLAANDTGGGDAHFPGHDDAYLTYTFATAGTYYIRVGRWVSGQTAAQPMLAGQTYQLHISLQGAAGSTTFTANNTSSLVADGGAGDDLLVGTLANDTLTGGADNDTASFANAFNGGSTTGVTVNLNTQGVAQNTIAAGNDTLSGIENLIGSSLNDTLTGNASVNVLEGGLGDDMLVGGAGDTASYAGATAGVTVSLALQGAGQNTGAAGTDTLIGFQNVAGSAFNDSLAGDANANTLTGGDGNDTLNPGANAGGTVDLLDGGNGTDTASFAGNASGVTATLAGAVDGTATIGGLAIATLRSIENLTGSSNNDTLTGDLNANVIEGGLGDDTLDGGLGVDTLRFTGATGATVNLGTVIAQNTGHGSDTITNFENVRTGSGADSITGDGNDNTFFEGGGNDSYDGAGGIDTVDYSAATSTTTVDLNTATANRGTSAGTDTITNIENVVGAAAAANTLTGNTAGNRLTGGSAGDTIQGNNGNDFIVGGAGNDTLLGGTSGFTDDGSADTVEGGLGNDFVSGGQGNDILRGGDGDDTLIGGITNLTQFFSNDGGDDTYEGGDGTDVAIMAYGNRAGVGASTVGIAFDIGSLAGNSNITWNGVVVGSMSSIERVTFLGTAVNDVVRGGGTLDSLTGNSGDDTLDGWIGNDILDGGLGNDILIGGEGLDTVTYAAATAGVTVDLRIAGAQNTGGYGIDTLSGFEYLTGSTFGDTLRGTDEFNLIIDSGIGAGATALSQTDSVFGYGGNDAIHVTRATGGVATNVNMDGGDGDDFIELRSGTLSTGGLFTNASGVVTSTGANAGYMSLGTTSDNRNVDVVTVDGGAGNDRIILSGVASATINAGSGADIVSISMRGATSVNNYQITLGSGADIIQFGVGATAGASTDVMVTARTSRVTDFEIGNAGDKFEMTTYLNNGVLAGSGYVAANGAFASGHMRLFQSGSDLLVQFDRDGAGVTNAFVTVFAISNGYTGGFTAFNFDGFIGNLTLTGIGVLDETITGATGNDVLSGGDGNDVLIGLAGTDTLDGGNGNDNLSGGTGDDTLIGGAGTDTLDGGTGTDTAVYAGNRGDFTITAILDGDGNVTGYTVTDDQAVPLDEGTDTLTGVETLEFADANVSLAGSVLLYDEHDDFVGAFTTIQGAVDAAQNDYRVYVGPGTYDEVVAIDVDITIEGPNAGVPGTGSRGAEAIIDGGVYVNATGVTLDGLTVLNGAMVAGNPAGIFVNADDATITNMVLTGELTNNMAAVLTTFGTSTTGLELSDSLITNWDWGTYFNPTTTFTVTGNSFDGNGNAIVGDDFGVGSFIDGNSFTNSTGSHVGIGSFDTVEDVRVYFDDPDDEEVAVNTFDPGSRAVSVFAYGDGTPGGQTLTGTEESNAIIASEFVAGSGTNSTFNGLGGNDYFYGGSSNDNLNGGADTDTASYDGNRGEYSIAFVTGAGGRVVGFSAVADNNTTTGVHEGSDSLSSIEVLEFANITLDATQPVQLFDVGNQLIGTFDTIQEAIDAAQDNYTIRVAAGTFDEDLLIDVGVRILGARQNVNVGGRDAAGGANETTIVGNSRITADDNVEINGVRFLNDATGGPVATLQIETGAGHLVTDSIFWSTVAGGATGVDERAISISPIASGDVHITDNLISGTSSGLFGTASWGRGIWFDGGGVNLEVLGNTIQSARTGVNLDMSGSSTATVDGNAFQNLGSGVSVGISDDNVVIGNNDHTNVGTDFNFRNLTSDVVFDADQAIDTLTPADPANDPVLVLGGSGNDDLSGTAGVDILDANNHPTLGATADTDALDGRGGNDALYGRFGDDSLTGGTGDDALIGGDGVDTGVYVDPLNPNNIALATDADPITPGNQAGWSVTTATEGTDLVTGVEILDGAGSGDVLLVGSGGFATIQEAVDAATDGDTILIAAGTYTEQVVIDGIDNLTLRSVGGQVTIKAPADLEETGRSSSDREIHGVLTVNDSLNVTIDDVDIDGDGRGNTVDEGTGAGQANFYGVFFRNSSGTLLDVDVTGVRDPYPGGTTLGGHDLVGGLQRGVGVVADNDTLLAFTMTGGSISDFQKNATVFSRADLDVSGVTITGGGAQTINAQNGFQATLSTGSISGNTITGIGYAGTQNVYSGSMLLFGNTDLDVNNNNIVGTNGEDTNAKVVGIFVVDFGTPNSGGSITGNTISFVDEGIDVTGDITPDPILIEDNNVTDIDGTNNDPLGVYFEPTPTVAVGHDVDGTAANDFLAGGAANDSFAGLGGSDTLRGNGGDDILNGGGNTDTAVYAGDFGDYTVTYTTDINGNVVSFLTVDDNNAGDGDEGLDTLSSVEVLQFGDITLSLNQRVQLFDGGDNLVATFDTIQEAVNASQDGYTIRAAAGTYDEDLVIDVGVTILGAQHGEAVGGRDAEDGTGETTIVGHAHVTATADVTLDGLRFLNDATTTGGGSANPTLQFQSGGTTGHLVTNSIFWSDVAGGANGVDDRAIAVTPIATGQIGITDNLISGASQGLFGTASWGRGIWFDGGGVDLEVSGNTIRWSRTGINLDMSGSSTATIEDNAFENLGTAVSVGISEDNVALIDNDHTNVGTDFNFRNLTENVVFDADSAIDVLTPAGANDPVVVLGGSGNDTLNGTAGADILDGNNSPTAPNAADSDVLDGEDGDDQLFGRNGTDTLLGGSGSDTLVGGDGDDALTGGANNDLLVGGAGIDRGLFSGAIASYTDTVLGWIVASPDGNDVLSEVEVAVEGSGQRNLLVGATGFANLQTALNNAENGDHLQLATGTYSGTFNYDDSGLVVFGTNATINATFATATAFGITVNGGGNNDSITTGANVDTLNGGGGNDTLNAGIGADALDGGAGNDRLIGGAGSDTLVGGSDTDTADYVGNFGAVKVDLSTGTGQFNFAQGDTYNGIENIDATEFGDILIGNAGVNVIRGNGGNDTIMGGAGADQLFGGAGTDTADYRGNFGAVSVNLLTGVGLFNFAQGDTLTDFENIEGTEFGDILTGNAGVNVINGNGGNDTVSGGAGADTLGGGAGIDTLTYAGNFGGVSVDLQAGTGQFNFAHNDVLAGFENLIGTSFGDILRGDGNANQIEGGDGADQLYGRAGIDVLIGGDQNDLLAGGTGADTLNGGAGTDTADYTGEFGAVSINLATGTGLFNSAQGDTLTGIENVIGTSFGDIFEGNGLDNVFTGGAGNDTFRFASGFAHDVITDFVGNGPAAGDTVRFAAGLFTDFADMMASSAQVGSDVVITLDAANTLTLQNTTLVSLDSSDFFYTL